MSNANCVKVVTSAMLIFIIGCGGSGYKNGGGKVTYSRTVANHYAIGSEEFLVKDADPKTFKIFNKKGYAKDDKTVFYQGEGIPGADTATFRYLGGDYAKDKHMVYFKGVCVPSADSDSFKYLKGNHARDKNRGYFAGTGIDVSTGISFTRLTAYYSTDGFDVFYKTEPLHIKSVNGFRPVFGNNEDNLFLGKVLSWFFTNETQEQSMWITDGYYYYKDQYKVPSENYKNIILYRNEYIAKDREWVYIKDRKLNFDEYGNKIIDTIDPETFSILESDSYDKKIYKDKYGYFDHERGRYNPEK